jgi:hypothetical protein
MYIVMLVWYMQAGYFCVDTYTMYRNFLANVPLLDGGVAAASIAKRNMSTFGYATLFLIFFTAVH